jgi:hypothetical protein
VSGITQLIKLSNKKALVSILPELTKTVELFQLRFPIAAIREGSREVSLRELFSRYESIHGLNHNHTLLG